MFKKLAYENGRITSAWFKQWLSENKRKDERGAEKYLRLDYGNGAYMVRFVSFFWAGDPRNVVWGSLHRSLRQARAEFDRLTLLHNF